LRIGEENDRGLLDYEVAKIHGAMQRVEDPVTRQLIAMLIDTLTLRIAAIEARPFPQSAANDCEPPPRSIP
jgi:hypothetical protein